MSSQLTIHVEMRNYPQAPVIGVLGRDDNGCLSIARSVTLTTPMSFAALYGLVKSLTRAWFEPELGPDPNAQLHDLLDAHSDPF